MKRKGFTLIELMIVLAVMAILAVVLVPKAGAFKNNAKNAGVTTNVNAVRAILESKTGNNFAKDAATLKTILQNAFSTATSSADSNIMNPFTNNYTLLEADPASADAASAIYLGTPTSLDKVKGSVVVVYTANTSYTVYGVDNNGTKIDEVTIKK
jgi:type IV pilus assembly protein PilA